MNLRIRKVAIEDAQIIFQFICELEETAFTFSDFILLYTHNINHKDFIYLVAIDEADTVVGYISCHGQILLHHCGIVFEIQELFVLKDWRNKGVGKFLIQTLLNDLSSVNYKSLEVTANISRLETHEFYKNSGFKETHKKFTRDLSIKNDNKTII